MSRYKIQREIATTAGYLRGQIDSFKANTLPSLRRRIKAPEELGEEAEGVLEQVEDAIDRFYTTLNRLQALQDQAGEEGVDTSWVEHDIQEAEDIISELTDWVDEFAGEI